jgi:hypothetical protein
MSAPTEIAAQAVAHLLTEPFPSEVLPLDLRQHEDDVRRLTDAAASIAYDSPQHHARPAPLLSASPAQALR